jgi:hypothetical protein
MVAGGSDIQHINCAGIGKKQMGQSSFGGGSLKSASSRSSAARNLHAILCFGQCLCWHAALQYLTCIHALQTLRLTLPPSSPHSAQHARVEKYLSQREKPFTNFVCVFVRANPNETLINPRQYSSFDRWF